MAFKFYTVLERLDKIEDKYEETTQFYVNVEAGVEDILNIKEKLEAKMTKLESDIKERMTKLESDIKIIKKSLGLS